MAYVSGSGIAQSPEDEEKDRQSSAAPTLSGGGSLMGAAPSTSGASSTGPKSTPGMGVNQNQSAMQPKGSGFVNLQSFLSPTVAGQQQNQVKTAGMGFNSGATKDFTGAVGDTTKKIDDNKAITFDAPSLSTTFQNAVGGNADATKQLQGAVNQTYTGPTSLDFDVAGNKNIQGLVGMGSNATALDTLHPGLSGNQQYTQGNRWLDSAMMQSDQGTNNEIGTIKKGTDQLGTWMDEQAKGVGDLASARAAEIEAARNATTQGLRGIGADIMKQAEGDAKQANIERGHVFAQAQDPEYAMRHLVNGQTVDGVDEGSGSAIAANFLGGTRGSQLQKLSEFLSDPSLAAAGSGPFRQASLRIGGTPTPVVEPTIKTPLDNSNVYHRDEKGNWVNGDTGEVFGGEWQLDTNDPSGVPKTWTNIITGETKPVGNIMRQKRNSSGVASGGPGPKLKS